MEPQSRQSVYGSSMRVSKKAASFTESVIRDMTRLAIKHDAINLAQGFPDFAAPQEIKDAAKRAIDADINQYAITWGAKPFRDAIAALCQKWGVVAITDEIYEFMTYEGTVHIPLITIPGMEDRTILINAMSKTYSVTGWRVGWCISSPELTSGIRKVHDFLTVGAAAPLQEAGVVALNLPDAYYRTLAAEYLERRDLMLGILDGAGFKTYKPYGAYYIMTDCSSLGYDDDVTAARALTETIGVASVPGSSFYSEPDLGRTKLRFSFCKKLETLHAAGERLARLQK